MLKAHSVVVADVLDVPSTVLKGESPAVLRLEHIIGYLSGTTPEKKTCDVVALPDTVVSLLASISKFSCVNARLTAVHEEVFQALSNVKEIDLSENKLTSIPLGLDARNCPHLNSLRLNKNKIRQITEGDAGHLSSELVELSMANNRLEYIADDFFIPLHSLTKINLEHNNLTSVSTSILHCQELTTVSLRYNPIERLPVGLLLSPKLKEISLDALSYAAPPYGRCVQGSELETIISLLKSRTQNVDILIKLVAEDWSDEYGAIPKVQNESDLYSLPLPIFSFLTLVSQRRINVSAVDKDGQTRLHLACAEGNCGLIFAFIQAGAPINALDNSSFSPLLHSTKTKVFSCVRALLTAGADVNYGGGLFGSPLHVAVVNFDVAITSLLLRHGANPSSQDKEGNTPLHVLFSIFDQGSLNRTNSIALLLLTKGANCNALSNEKWAPLHLAARRSQIHALNFVIDYMDAINQTENAETYRNGLVSAVSKCSKFDINLRGGIQGWTPCHLAAYAGNVQALSCILRLKANPLKYNLRLRNPRYVAAGNFECYKLLWRAEKHWLFWKISSGGISLYDSQIQFTGSSATLGSPAIVSRSKSNPLQLTEAALNDQSEIPITDYGRKLLKLGSTIKLVNQYNAQWNCPNQESPPQLGKVWGFESKSMSNHFLGSLHRVRSIADSEESEAYHQIPDEEDGIVNLPRESSKPALSHTETPQQNGFLSYCSFPSLPPAIDTNQWKDVNNRKASDTSDTELSCQFRPDQVHEEGSPYRVSEMRVIQGGEDNKENHQTSADQLMEKSVSQEVVDLLDKYHSLTQAIRAAAYDDYDKSFLEDWSFRDLSSYPDEVVLKRLGDLSLDNDHKVNNIPSQLVNKVRDLFEERINLLMYRVRQDHKLRLWFTTFGEIASLVRLILRRTSLETSRLFILNLRESELHIRRLQQTSGFIQSLFNDALIEESKIISLLSELPMATSEVLYLAIQRKFARLLQLLLANGFNPNEPDTQRRNPIHACIESDAPLCLLMLLYHPDIDLNQNKDSRGHTPLSLAVELGRVQCLSLLINRGASVELQLDPKMCQTSATLLEVLAYQISDPYVSKLVLSLLKLNHILPPLIRKDSFEDLKRIVPAGTEIRQVSTILGSIFSDYKKARIVGSTTTALVRPAFRSDIEDDHEFKPIKPHQAVTTRIYFGSVAISGWVCFVCRASSKLVRSIPRGQIPKAVGQCSNCSIPICEACSNDAKRSTEVPFPLLEDLPRLYHSSGQHIYVVQTLRKKAKNQSGSGFNNQNSKESYDLSDTEIDTTPAYVCGIPRSNNAKQEFIVNKYSSHKAAATIRRLLRVNVFNTKDANGSDDKLDSMIRSVIKNAPEEVIANFNGYGTADIHWNATGPSVSASYKADDQYVSGGRQISCQIAIEQLSECVFGLRQYYRKIVTILKEEDNSYMSSNSGGIWNAPPFNSSRLWPSTPHTGCPSSSVAETTYASTPRRLMSARNASWSSMKIQSPLTSPAGINSLSNHPSVLNPVLHTLTDQLSRDYIDVTEAYIRDKSSSQSNLVNETLLSSSRILGTPRGLQKSKNTVQGILGSGSLLTLCPTCAVFFSSLPIHLYDTQIRKQVHETRARKKPTF